MNATHHPISHLARATSLNDATQTVQASASIPAVDLGPNARTGEALQVLYITSSKDFPEEVEAMEEGFGRHQLNAGLLDLGDIEGDDEVEKRRDLESQIALLHEEGRINDATLVIISMHGDDEAVPADHDAPSNKVSDGVENAPDSNGVKNSSYMLSVLDGALEVDFQWLISCVRNTMGDGVPYKGQIHLTACGAKRCMDLVADDGFSYVAYGGKKSVFILDAKITCLAVIDLLGQCHRNRIAFPTTEKIAEHAASISGATVSFKTPTQSASFSALKSTPQPMIVTRSVSESLATKAARVLEEKLAHGSASSVKKTIEKFGKEILANLDGEAILEVIDSKRDAIEKLNLLKENNFSLDYVNEEGYSLLHIAVENKDMALLDFCLDAELNINQKTKIGERPLHIAVSAGDVDSVKRLVTEGADPSLWFIGGNEKYNIFHIAIGFENNEVIKAILESPLLEINAVTGDGQKSALHFAAELGNSRAIGLLAAKRADLNVKDKNGDTPLHLAVRSGSLKAARALIDAGADLSLANNEGVQPLMLAALKKNGEFMVGLLISHGARINATDQYGDTALHHAAQAGRLPSVRVLLNAGANLQFINRRGYTPEECARRFMQRPVVKFLREFRPGPPTTKHRL
jgi:ankyrin repeat protein